MKGSDKIVGGIAVLLGLWSLSQLSRPEGGSWVPQPGAPGRVRILQFRTSVGALLVGEKAQLCYGVQNARSVRIVPVREAVYPSASRCMEVGPRHTTHYTIMAIGFDGSVATRSLTLPVQARLPEMPESPRELARLAVAATEPAAMAP
jgi:hypothetical protein